VSAVEEFPELYLRSGLKRDKTNQHKRAKKRTEQRQDATRGDRALETAFGPLFLLFHLFCSSFCLFLHPFFTSPYHRNARTPEKKRNGVSKIGRSSGRHLLTNANKPPPRHTRRKSRGAPLSCVPLQNSFFDFFCKWVFENRIKKSQTRDPPRNVRNRRLGWSVFRTNF
jgi:hypothetical protein